MRFISKDSVREFLLIILYVFLSFFSSCICYALLFYIHEGGHAFFGAIGNILINKEIGEIHIDGWINWPFPIPDPNYSLFSIPVPTSTSVIPNPGNEWIAFSGTIAVTCFIILMGCFAYKNAIKNEREAIILVVIGVIFNQLGSNQFCGTDNFTHTFYLLPSQCSVFLFSVEILIPCFFFLYFFRFFSHRLVRL